MKKIFKKEVIIGICVIIALVLLFSGIEFLKGINVFKPANHYFISYTNVAGLDIASPVTVNGFKVGQVLDINYEYDNPGHVSVEISLDKDLMLPLGTKALLASDLLGSASIILEMGTDKNFYNVGEKIEGVVPVGIMDNVTNDMLPKITAIMPKVDSLLTSINKIVSSPAIYASIKHLNEITTNLSETTKKLNDYVESLSPIMSNVKGVTMNFNDISADLADVSEKLKSLPIDSTMRNVNETTNNLQQLTGKINVAINDKKSTLGLLMNDTDLYDNLNGAASSLDSLFIDVKKNPKRYISIKLL